MQSKRRCREPGPASQRGPDLPAPQAGHRGQSSGYMLSLACRAPRMGHWGRVANDINNNNYYFLLRGIFLTQESNLSLLHCRQILYQLSYKGNP